MKTDKVTRLEVIDRTKTIYDVDSRFLMANGEDTLVELSLQENGKTLIVFIDKK